MNRKFYALEDNDKDKKIIKEIKKIILSKKVSLVLNLHDGHGFYRKENQGNIFNPNAWGQTCVIDQFKLKQTQAFGNLNNIALTVKKNINMKLLKEHHSFDIRNTNTKFDDEAMQLSLTYFAVTNNKPAFAIESSKNLPSLSKKVFYQLLAIEEFMKIMKISFEKDFDLNEKELNKILQEYGSLQINNNISLSLSDIKKSLSFIPLKSRGNVFKFFHPLGSIKKKGDDFIVYIGHKNITKLKPQYFKLSKNCLKKFSVKVDKKIKYLDFSSAFELNDDFNIIQDSDFRVNVIGFSSNKHLLESGVDINQKSLNKKYSVDKSGKVYRIEFYKGNNFCFMSTVHFK